MGTESCSLALKTAVVPVLTSKFHADNEEIYVINIKEEAISTNKCNNCLNAIYQYFMLSIMLTLIINNGNIKHENHTLDQTLTKLAALTYRDFRVLPLEAQSGITRKEGLRLAG